MRRGPRGASRRSRGGCIWRAVGRTLPLLPLGALLFTGCHFGPQAHNHPRVQTPHGAEVTVFHAEGQFSAELLEVREGGLLLLEGTRLVHATFDRIERIRLQGTSTRRLIQGAPPTERSRERLRRASRHPYGIPAGLLQELLARHGQAEVHELGANPPEGSTEGPVEAFLAVAREASARYHNPDVARMDGYRPVGPDFPGMGEHWVNVGFLLDGGLDPAAPPILSYAPSPTGARLVGVVYAVPLGPGERAPDFPVPADHWHEHTGSIDEESLVLQHIAAGAASQEEGRRGRPGGAAGAAGHRTALEDSHHFGAPPTGTRLAVLHAWVWLENPAGVFATDNWALPYFRLDLDPPVSGTGGVEAAKMLSFASGAEAYYLAAARALARPGADEEAALAEVFGTYRREVEEMVAGWRDGAGTDAVRDAPSGASSAADLRSPGAGAPGGEGTNEAMVAALRDAWDRMWRDASDGLTGATARGIGPLR